MLARRDAKLAFPLVLVTVPVRTLRKPTVLDELCFELATFAGLRSATLGVRFVFGLDAVLVIDDFLFW